MASEDDYGLSAYNAIASQLEQWGETTPTPSSSRKSRSSLDSASTTFHSPAMTMNSPMETPAKSMGTPYQDMDYDDATSSRFKGGVDTPMPTRHEVENMDEEIAQVVMDDEPSTAFDGVDSYQPYRDALLNYIQNRERITNSSSREVVEGGNTLMQIDNVPEASAEDVVALEEADLKYLDSLASICFTRSKEMSTTDCTEGNFWDLLLCLRSRGLASLFYCVNGESPPELKLNADPKTMIDAYPADVVNACLGSSDGKPSSLPLERLNAALEWIQACHYRNWQNMLAHDYQDSDDPVLPPPRRRTMWPSTLEEMKRTNNYQFHPDAPLNSRSPSPTGVSLNSSDEMDDARLLRACFILIQSGRPDQAIELTKQCGQPWRSISWLGGEALDSEGNGNPTRRLWKRQCRKVLPRMMSMVHDEGKTLHSSSAYEAAILAVLSDSLDCATENPVFATWEDGVHAILSAERGIIQENVLLSHDDARAEILGGKTFPYPGMEGGNDIGPEGFDGDMSAALEKLDGWAGGKFREASGEPYRNGMRSFLIGQEALKDYIMECSALAIEMNMENDENVSFLRFVVHLVVYVEMVLPELTFQMVLPDGISNDDSLRDVLILKYIKHLSSMRDLWGYVPLYTSLLSNESILDTFSEFLIHVHNDKERQIMLSQARDFFDAGLDRYILRNVVREMIQCDHTQWRRSIGEDEPPVGVTPADARMMRSVLWLCYYPEHYPDALVCANMLLRRFMLESGSDDHHNKQFLYSSKLLTGQILPKDIIDITGAYSSAIDETIAGRISIQMAQNLQAEYLSIKRFVQAHTSYLHFIDAITKSSPCHQSERKTMKGASTYETEIALKMERNAFRQKKIGLCKTVIEYATKASDAIMAVLTFGGGWLVDQTLSGDEIVDISDEARDRLEEMKQIRSIFVPMAIYMLYEVLNKTAMWMEQIVHDTIDQFDSAGVEMLFSLFGTFDEPDKVAAELLRSSRASPAYWHKKAISLSSIVANDGHVLHQAMSSDDMKNFLILMADSQTRYNECSDQDALFDL